MFPSCQVDWVRIEAASERACDASELLHVSDGALVLLSNVVAEKVEARATSSRVSLDARGCEWPTGAYKVSRDRSGRT